MKNMFLVICFVLSFWGSGIAESDEQSAAEQFKTKSLSFAVKSCMKIYFINADFQNLKNENVAAINRKTGPQFEADYSQAWAVLKKCPYLVSKYRLRQRMTKEEVLKVVNRLTRDDCLAAVDNIPDEVIVDQFNKGIADPDIQDKPFNEQINLFMKKSIVGK